MRILLGGAGIGSIIAECALRFGFENITIVDGDKVEESNLNRQNYVHSDIGKYKAEALSKRLLKINPKAEISFFNTFINKTNVEEIVFGHHIAINALDFKDDTPLVFDQVCSDKKIPVLHPYNFGWAGFLTIVKPKGYQLSEISKDFNGFELKVAEFCVKVRYVLEYARLLAGRCYRQVPYRRRHITPSAIVRCFMDCGRALCQCHV